MKKLVFIQVLSSLLVLSFVSSCSPKFKKQLIGTWTIDFVNEKGEESPYLYLSNLMTFKNGGICTMPITSRTENRKGEWTIEEQDNILLLTIKVENNKLNGAYKLKYWKDFDKKLLKATLVREDSLCLTCSKMLHNFE